jgi:hypothetical protein
MQALAERLDARVRASTERLIEAHGLSGRAVRDVLTRARSDYATTAPVGDGPGGGVRRAWCRAPRAGWRPTSPPAA